MKIGTNMSAPPQGPDSRQALRLRGAINGAALYMPPTPEARAALEDFIRAVRTQNPNGTGNQPVED